MDRFGELVPSERLLAFLERLDAAAAKIVVLAERFGNMEKALADLRMAVTKHPAKEFYLVEEFAEMVKRAPYTVREWCRLRPDYPRQPQQRGKGRQDGSPPMGRAPDVQCAQGSGRGLFRPSRSRSGNGQRALSSRRWTSLRITCSSSSTSSRSTR